MQIHYPNTDITTPVHADEIMQELNSRSYGLEEEEPIQAGVMDNKLIFFGIAAALLFIFQGNKSKIATPAAPESEVYYD